MRTSRPRSFVLVLCAALAVALPAPSAGAAAEPTVTITAPADGAVVSSLPLTIRGRAHDDRSVRKVAVSVRQRTSGLWLQGNGSWGPTRRELRAALTDPGGATTAWRFVWDAPSGSGRYTILVEATDDAGRTGTRSRGVRLTLGLDPRYDRQVRDPGGVAPLYPAGATLGSGGVTYVADSGRSRIVAIAAGGGISVVSPAADGWNDPRDLVVDATNGARLWVVDTSDDEVVHLTTSGTILDTFTGLTEPYGVANDATGVYVADTYAHRVVKLDAGDGSVLWQQTTCDAEAFVRPRDVTVGPGGDVFLADTDNDRIVRLDPGTGQCVDAFGSAGSGEGEFQAPRSLVGDGGGGLWVTEGGNQRLQHVTAAGAFLGTIGSFGDGKTRFRSPHCVYRHGARVGVCDTFNYRITRFAVSPAGVPSYDSTIGGTPPADGGFHGAFDVAYGPDGSMYAADWFNHRIQKFTAAGRFVKAWGGYGPKNGALIFPRGVVVTPDGDTVVITDSENNRLSFFGTGGGFQGTLRPDGDTLARPHQTALDPDGSFWIADTGHHRILHLAKNGTVLHDWNDGGVLTSPRGVAVDAAGDVYVANSGDDVVARYSPTGVLLDTIAGAGAGAGQVNDPYGLRIVGTGAAARLLVADRGNDRVSVFRLDGTFVRSFGQSGGGAGRFDQPQGMDRSPVTGEIAVADFGNDRLSIWTT